MIRKAMSNAFAMSRRLHGEIAALVAAPALEPELRAAGVRHVSVFDSLTRGEDIACSDVDLALDSAPAQHAPRLTRNGMRSIE